MDAQAVKTIGGIAQIGGVIWLVWDLVGQSRHVGQLARAKARLRSWWRRMQHWVLRRPRDAVVLAVTAAAAASASGSLTVSVDRGLPVASPGATVEERLTLIEQWAEQLRRQFADERRALEEARQQDREAVRRGLDAATRQFEARIAEVRELVARLERVTVGGVSLRWYSVPILLAGIVCTTWPGGIAEHVLFWLRPSWFEVLVAFGCAGLLVRKTLTALYRS